MKKVYQALIIAALVSAASVVTTAQQMRIREGGTLSAVTVYRYSTGFASYGSVGQGAIHTIAINDTAELQTGIWCQSRMTSSAAENTKVVLPNVAVRTGDTVSFDVPFEAPCSFFLTDKSRPWSLTISFNRSMIEPLGYTSIKDDGQRYHVTFTGSTSDASGVLAKIRLATRLGNDTVTDLSVDKFEWTDIPRQSWTADNGSIKATGLCITDGSTRLLKERTRPAVMVSPNPSAGPSVSVRTYAAQPERGILRLLDLQGMVIREIGDVAVSPELPVTLVQMEYLPAGSYVMQLTVPSGTTSTMFVRLP